MNDNCNTTINRVLDKLYRDRESIEDIVDSLIKIGDVERIDNKLSELAMIDNKIIAMLSISERYSESEHFVDSNDDELIINNIEPSHQRTLKYNVNTRTFEQQ